MIVELTIRGPLLTIGAMKIHPVLCQRCGAPLEVTDQTVRFVTCVYCSTPLEIMREATQSRSRILEPGDAATEDNSRKLNVIELQNELQRLDREWQDREGMIDGMLRACEERKDLALLAVPLVVVALIMMVIGFSKWDLQTLILALIPLLGAAIAFRGLQKARSDLHVLKDLEVAHQFRRRELVNAIERARTR